MANIDQELRSIMQAVYGRDVRQSIHDAIQAVNTSAVGSALQAETSAQNALVSETNAKLSENNSKTSELNSKASEDNAKLSEDNAKDSETNAKASEDNAKESETNAKSSEEKAKTSEDNSKASEDNAKLSETNSKASEEKAKVSEDNAKLSEDNAKASEELVESYKTASELARDRAEEAAKNAEAIAGIGIATPTEIGLVKVDNESITIDPDGTIKVNVIAPKATDTTLGIVKVDNTTVKVDEDGTLSVPLATGTKNGVVKPDTTSITINAKGVISVKQALLDDINTKFENVNEEVENLGKSVSDGKTLVASAITDKGVATEPTDSFQTMADNISAIMSGGGLDPSEYEPVLLWSNPNPTASFASQTISLDLNEYAGVIVDCGDRGEALTCREYLSIGESGYLGRYGSGYSLARKVVVSNNGVTFGTSYVNGSASDGTMQPLRIYGVKKAVVEVETTIEDAPILLWTNPSPNSAFAGQKVALNLTDYEGLIIKTSNTRCYVKKSDDVSWFGFGHYGNNSYTRNITAIDDTGITFGNGYNNATVQNTAHIPFEIYGVKRAVVEVESNAPELLWVNANPRTSFSAQTIALDLTGYERVIVSCYASVSASQPTCNSIAYTNDDYQYSIGHSGYDSGSFTCGREYQIVANGIQFFDGARNGSTNNNMIIPYKIYGVKGVLVEEQPIGAVVLGTELVLNTIATKSYTVEKDVNKFTIIRNTMSNRDDTCGIYINGVAFLTNSLTWYGYNGSSTSYGLQYAVANRRLDKGDIIELRKTNNAYVQLVIY